VRRLARMAEIARAELRARVRTSRCTACASALEQVRARPWGGDCSAVCADGDPAELAADRALLEATSARDLPTHLPGRWSRRTS
jgi:hypothetical protein